MYHTDSHNNSRIARRWTRYRNDYDKEQEDGNTLFALVFGEVMAEKRMFSKSIIDSDAFLDMPTSARLLYFDLNMRADDDGFVNSPNKIIRMTGATIDDLKILLAKKFVIGFDNGVIVIKHWKIHNYIRKDTYHRTNYIDELNMLKLDENKAYTMTESQAVDGTLTQSRLDKIRLEKNSLEYPTIEDVIDYVEEKELKVNPTEFFNYYEKQEWTIEGESIRDWKSLCYKWHKNNVADVKRQKIELSQLQKDANEGKFAKPKKATKKKIAEVKAMQERKSS